MAVRRLPLILFGLLCAGFLSFVAFSAHLLPDHVASHFNAGGQPDGWASKAGYLWTVSLMGLALPLFIVGLTYLTRFFPDWMINLPHKDYWLSSSQRAHTNSYIFHHAFWLACLMVCLLGAAHFLTIRANQSNPVQLPGTPFLTVMIAFLLGVGAWAIALIRHFRGPG